MSPSSLLSEILDKMRELYFPKETRRSVRRNEKDGKRGFVLGYVINYNKGWVASRFSRRYPEFARLVCDYCKAARPSFKFTSVMVNEGGSALHVDSLNSGKSLIVGLGDYTGGDLWQYPDDVLDIYKKLKSCDGRLPHMTLPFKGERFSLVFFNMAGNHKAPSQADQRFLGELGFHPPSHREITNAEPRSDLLSEAALTLKTKRHVPSSAIGDFLNKHIENKTMSPRRRQRSSRSSRSPRSSRRRRRT
jgi:hypothetical protein